MDSAIHPLNSGSLILIYESRVFELWGETKFLKCVVLAVFNATYVVTRKASLLLKYD